MTEEEFRRDVLIVSMAGAYLAENSEEMSKENRGRLVAFGLIATGLIDEPHEMYSEILLEQAKEGLAEIIREEITQ